MNHRRVPRPRPLDTRADSPMLDDVHSTQESPVDRTLPHGLLTPSTDLPSSGFTAVNGEISRSVSLRPYDSARPLTVPKGDHHTKVAASNGSPLAPTNAHHGWRPDAPPSSDTELDRNRHESSAASKRKRNDSSGSAGRRQDRRGDPARVAHDPSPKRRSVTSISGGRASPHRARTYSSEPHDGLERATAANNVRAPTPVYLANHGDPPPPASGVAEAHLQASLAKALGQHNEDRTPSVRRDLAPRRYDPALPTDRSPSPEAGPLDHAQIQPYRSEDDDDMDPKKRKRNFSNRTKTGCHTCRARKKKCDEGKPTCDNCRRGQFPCGGYGARPPGSAKISAVRTVVPLQPNNAYERSHAPAPFHEMPPHHYRPASPRQQPGPPWEAARPDPHAPPQHRYGPPPGPMDHRPPSGRESWGQRPAWPSYEQPPSYLAERLPPVDFSGVPPPMQGYLPDRLPPPPEPWATHNHHHHHQVSYRAPPVPASVMGAQSAQGSSISSSTARSRAQPPMPLPGPPSERMKMLTGLPFDNFFDEELVRDRTSCKRAVEAYNSACAASSTASGNMKESFFKAIQNPTLRGLSDISYSAWSGPLGESGSKTIVDAPFMCEFGYNIRLGNETSIGANCLMEDACSISIGDHVVVGKNVSFLCIFTDMEVTQRKGIYGPFMAGAIKVEDDCIIGANATIMPFRTIGKGAVVGASSVVTRDVKPYTVVAGNPARLIRKRKIEVGSTTVNRHEDGIQEENDRMLEQMRKKPFSRERLYL